MLRPTNISEKVTIRIQWSNVPVKTERIGSHSKSTLRLDEADQKFRRRPNFHYYGGVFVSSGLTVNVNINDILFGSCYRFAYSMIESMLEQANLRLIEGPIAFFKTYPTSISTWLIPAFDPA